MLMLDTHQGNAIEKQVVSSQQSLFSMRKHPKQGTWHMHGI